MLDAIVIGGSAGALEPLIEILKPLSTSIAAPIVVVIHVLPDHPSLIPELLAHACPDRTVRESKNLESLEPKTIYVARPNSSRPIGRSRSRASHR